VVYVWSPASRFDVKTGKAGLFGFAGHAHVVRARGFAGRVVYFPNAPSESRVEIVVPADSLDVLTPRTRRNPQGHSSHATDVLHVVEYPLISFVSTAVTPTVDGFQVQGRLTLAGLTGDVSCDVRAELGGTRCGRLAVSR